MVQARFLQQLYTAGFACSNCRICMYEGQSFVILDQTASFKAELPMKQTAKPPIAMAQYTHSHESAVLCNGRKTCCLSLKTEFYAV